MTRKSLGTADVLPCAAGGALPSVEPAGLRRIQGATIFLSTGSAHLLREVYLVVKRFQEARAAALAAMTQEERATYDAALEVERDRLRAAELKHTRSRARGSRTVPQQDAGRAEGADSL